MAQITSGIHSILDHSSVYDFFQTIMGARRVRTWLVSEFIRPKPDDTIIDIGCGTGELLDYLPRGISYFGFDLSPEYIASARKNHSNRGRFECGDVNDFDLETQGQADLVVSFGVLHHLDDSEVETLLRTAWDRLRPGGRFVSMDCAIVQGQSPIARALILRDRGQNARTPEAYKKLIASQFGDVRYEVRHDLLNLPYTHIAAEGTAAK